VWSRRRWLLAPVLLGLSLLVTFDLSSSGNRRVALISAADPGRLDKILYQVDPASATEEQLLDIFRQGGPIVLDMRAYQCLPLEEIASLLKRNRVCLIVVDCLRQRGGWDPIPMEALSPERLVEVESLKRFGERPLSGAIERMHIDKLLASKPEIGAYMNALAIPRNLSKSNSPFVIVASWGYGESFVIGLSLSLEQLASCTEGSTVLEELMRYGEDELQRELPVLTPSQ